MKAIYSIMNLCILIAIAMPMGAQGPGVTVIPMGEELIETDPGGIVTTVFLVTNKSAEEREFIADISLPEGWKLITGHFPFDLDAGKDDSRLVSFLIPQRTLAGRYEITYSVKDREYPSISDSYTIYVVVLPVSALEVRLLDAPKYIIAGDTYQASFAIINGSNAESSVRLKVHSGENLPYILDAEKLQLAPSSSKTVTVTVTTDAEMRDILMHRLELSAQMVEQKQIKAQATSRVEVIPRIFGVGERYHKLPVEITASGHFYRRKEETTSGFQAKIFGEGTLDAAGKTHIKFLARGPDILRKSPFGERDELSFELRTKEYEVGVGDDAYFLSTLTENSRYGRGIRGRINVKGVSLGSYYHRNRWNASDRERIAGYANYSIGGKHNVGLNYLGGPDRYGIVSLSGQLKPMQDTDVELEFASGEDDYAYLLRLYGRRRRVSYYLRLVHAGPDYPGDYKDVDSISANMAIPIISKLRLKGNFQRIKNNLDMDSALGYARLNKYYQFDLTHRFATQTAISLGYRNQTSEDRFPQSAFDSDEETYKLSARQSLRMLSLSTSFERGESRNNLTGQDSRLEVYNFSTNFSPTSGQSYSTYIYWRETDHSAEGSRRGIIAGLDGSFQIANSTHLKARFRANERRHLENTTKSRILEVDLRHKLFDKHRISIRGRHISNKEYDRSAVMAEYTVPIGIPVSRKRDTGSVKGYVYNEASREPVPDVILRFNGSTAVSDENGYFTFPLLKPGVHHLDVNMSRVGMGLVTLQKMPMEVNVTGGEDTHIQISIAEGATLLGQIMVYNFEEKGLYNSLLNSDKDDKPKKMVKSEGLANGLLELTNGKQIKRRLTDDKGRFSFEDVSPGIWTLNIYCPDLPEYHYLEKDSLEVKLEEGSTKEIEVRVLPRERRIRIMEEGGTIIEEKSE